MPPEDLRAKGRCSGSRVYKLSDNAYSIQADSEAVGYFATFIMHWGISSEGVFVLQKKGLLTRIATTLALGTSLLGVGLAHAATAHVSKKTVHQSSVAHRSTAPQTVYPLTIKDQTGQTVVLKAQPTRIISLTLGNDEALFNMIPIKRLIGVDYTATEATYSHVTKAIAKDHIPVFGDANGTLNAEAIIKAKPDLVLVADYVNQKVVAQLKNAGIPVYEFNNFNSIANIEQNIQVLGQLVNAQGQAAKLVDQMKANLAWYQAHQPKKRPTVLYDSYNYVAGTNTTANDLIRIAGGVNAAAKVNGWAQVTPEQVIAMNPDVIVIPDDSGAADTELKTFLANPAFAHLKAVVNHHVYTASDANLSAVSQFVVWGVHDMRQIILNATK
ncbi:ABC transporter substrate-binding protein [Ferroacidibacillus organovorans]|uniref:Fe/B12 periplasmic-binding domain-containing protein n=1 Tax=Ferroacidibacillus organovorans TaxID=1765683 RepID=A0A101XQ15_9BACL|nr:ABC transporter substrate-binding protein [Ferroacidibacillus organovorans]KUO95470.1 hypothetical protein ATW55_03145 [Ferroacidibacillus organovorans]